MSVGRHRRHPDGPGRSIVAAVLSALVPGLGQLFTPAWRTGVWLLASSLAMAVGVIVSIARWPALALETTVRSDWLLRLAVVLAGVAGVRILVVVHAYREVRPAGPGMAKRVAMGGLVLILGVVAVPHVWAIKGALTQRDLLLSVFSDRPEDHRTMTLGGREGVAGATPVGAERVRLEPLVSRTPSIASRMDGRVSVLAVDLVPRPAERDLGRLNVLLLGSDAGYLRTGVRTDTMIVVSIDRASGDAVMIGIPRNLQRARFASEAAQRRFPRGFNSLANQIYSYGENHPQLWPDSDRPGAAAIMEVASEYLGIPIHHYALVDLTGLVDVIDTLGGVDIDVTERINDEIRTIEKGGSSTRIDVRPGPHHFDGKTALAYVRARRGSSDYRRMSRQRCLLAALADQTDVLTLARAFSGLAPVIARSVDTDVPLDELPDLLRLGRNVNPSQVRSLMLVPRRFSTSRPNYERAHRAVAELLAGPTTDPDADRLELGDICGSS